jgi:beta-N-acetylhexosaminidase
VSADAAMADGRLVGASLGTPPGPPGWARDRAAGRSIRGWRIAAVVAILLAGVGCGTLAPPPEQFDALLPRLGELLLVGFDGTQGEGNTELERLLCETRAGGVLLFGRNVTGREQVRHLTEWISARARACGRRPVLVGVDAEGGRVMRLGLEAGYTATLSHRDLGDAGDLVLSELEARRIGGRLREAGIAWNMAPVVDVGYNAANPVIVGAGRSFGADPVQVTAHARAYLAGMHAAGLLTVLKHFPGHGSSFGDSHHGFVDVTDTARPELELAPYRGLMAEGVVDAVMTAHVFNRRLDGRYPATLSRATISGLLRGELGWDGVVVSDDLRMRAIVQHYGLGEAAVLAVDAGVDLLLIGDDRLPGGGSAAQVALMALRDALRQGRLAPVTVEAALARLDALHARRAP